MSISFSPAHRQADGSVFINTMADNAVNVSNTNGFAVMTALGMEPDYCGEMEADELAGRCLLALGLDAGDMLDVPTDPGTAALLEAFGAGTEGGPTVVSIPRREGYMIDVLGRIRELAVAMSGGLVGWA